MEIHIWNEKFHFLWHKQIKYVYNVRYAYRFSATSGMEARRLWEGVGTLVIRDLSDQETAEMSSIELAYLLLNKEREPLAYQQLFNKITETKQFEAAELDERRTKLFTALNIDGRFAHLGANHWGLKSWYSVDKSDDDLSKTIQKKTADEQTEEDPEQEDQEELEDLKDELDEFAQQEDKDAEENED